MGIGRWLSCAVFAVALTDTEMAGDAGGGSIYSAVIERCQCANAWETLRLGWIESASAPQDSTGGHENSRRLLHPILVIPSSFRAAESSTG